MDLRQWLVSCNCRDVRLGLTTISTPRRTYVFSSAHYFQDRTISPGCRAYSEGQREYTQEAIYVLGIIPSFYWRKKVCFTVEGDNREWYVAGWWPQTSSKDWKQNPNPAGSDTFHPLGSNFLLHPWTTGSIDDFEKTSYQRIQLAFDAS